MRKYSLILFLLLFFAGCKDDPEQSSIDFGYSYLPLEIGHWVEYEVDSIVFDPFTASVDTYSFRLRDEILEVYQDLESRDVYRVEQSYQTGSSADPELSFRRSYSLIIDGVRAEALVNNLKTVPLVFPPKEGTTWDGNAFNSKDAENFEFDWVDEVVSLTSERDDTTLRVIQWNDTNNFVIKRFSEERYSRQVGLTYKEYFDIETQFQIDSGLHWIQRYVDSKPRE